MNVISVLDIILCIGLIILGVAMLIKNIYNQVKGRGCGCCKNCSGCSNALCEDKKKNK